MNAANTIAMGGIRRHWLQWLVLGLCFIQMGEWITTGLDGRLLLTFKDLGRSLVFLGIWLMPWWGGRAPAEPTRSRSASTVIIWLGAALVALDWLIR